jgi:hypothetical protein
MSKPYDAVGAILLEDNCDVIAVKNYGTSDILDGMALQVDATNLDTTQALLAVAAIAGAQANRCGFAKGTIPAGGTGMMVTGGITRGYSASTAFTLGNRVLGAATGQVAEGTTAGQLLGTILKTETTTRPLILVSFS